MFSQHTFDNIYHGRAAEFFVASVLEQMGLRTVHVDLPNDDLWVGNPDKDIVRVQVKSARQPYLRKDRAGAKPKYNFKLAKKSNGPIYRGVFILVAMDIKLMFARTWDDSPPVTVKYYPTDFTPEEQESSIKRAFAL